MTTPDSTTTGTVLGEEARRALIDAQLSRKRFLGEDGYTSVAVQANDEAADEALAVLAPHIADLLSAAREEGAAAERERIATELRERFEPTDRGAVRADDPETTRWMQGWDEAAKVAASLAAELDGPS